MCLIMCLLMHLIMQVYTFRASYLKCRLSTSLYRPINEISRSLDKIVSLKKVGWLKHPFLSQIHKYIHTFSLSNTQFVISLILLVKFLLLALSQWLPW